MSNLLRRFEILLPLRFNDGKPVPNELIADTLLELRQKFTPRSQTLFGNARPGNSVSRLGKVAKRSFAERRSQTLFGNEIQ
jgi:hypothetical protein